MDDRLDELINIKKRKRDDNDEIVEPELKKQKKESKDVVFDFIDDILATEKTQKDKVKKKWMSGLTEDEINTYSLRLDKLKKTMKNRIVSEAHIIKSNLPFNEKIKLLEKIQILRQTIPHTEEYYNLKNSIYTVIHDDSILTKDDIEIETKLKDFSKDDDSLKLQILRCNHPDKVKYVLYQRYNKLHNLHENAEEYYKTKQWIENVLKVPTKIVPMFKSDEPDELMDRLEKIQNVMTKQLYGQKKAKEKVLEIISTMFVNPICTKNCFAMVGKPGVGKTSFAKCLANALNLPFYQISLGGITDSSFILGHSLTYITSKYGEIVNALINMKQKNGILFLDEFDKLSKKGSDVSKAFLHILDYSQNNEFKDQYMPEVPIDLSNLLIIISVNDVKNIDKIAVDRMPLILFSDYSFKDKVKIGMNYFIPKIEKRLKFKEGDIILSKHIMKYIIEKSSYEDAAGVRQLERNLLNIYERLNVLRMKFYGNSEITFSYKIKGFNIPFKLKEKHIDTLFDEFEYEYE
jgi:ATP-dependent Lon protease